MSMKVKHYQISLLIFLLVLFCVPYSFAQDKAYIGDINANPARFMNMMVRLAGRVQSSNPAGPTTPGSYVLVDDSFETITVLTYNPPAPGSEITIDGMVQIDPSTQLPYVREVKVVNDLPVPIYAIVAAIVVLALLIALIVILRKPAKTPEPVAVGGYEPSRPRTEKISVAEERTMSSVKTDKVPTKPAQLEILSGDKAGQQVLLVMDNLIGRDKGNVRFTTDRGVSGEHARIKYVGGRYYISNLSLTNPTKVNDQAVDDECELKEGDVIRMGTVQAKFKYMK